MIHQGTGLFVRFSFGHCVSSNFSSMILTLFILMLCVAKYALHVLYDLLDTFIAKD